MLIASTDIVLLFRLADMIGFYASMVTSLLGPGAGLSKAVTGCHDASTARFYDLVKQQSVAMLQSAGRYPADLLPPRVVQETLSRLVSVDTPPPPSLPPCPPCPKARRSPACSLRCFLGLPAPARLVVCVHPMHPPPLLQNDILVVYSRSMVPTEEREASFAPVWGTS